MLYFKLFFRNFKKNRLFTLLNLSSLVIGISAFLYINQYVVFERSFDNYHSNAESVFRITSQKTQGGEEQTGKASSSVVLKPFIDNNFEDIIVSARVHILDARRLIVRVPQPDGTETSFVEKSGYHAEKDFFKLFTTNFIAGNPETALEKPNSIVLTEKLAKKYFGNEEALGKVISLSDEFDMEYEITGVVKDVPFNSHFRYDMLISFNTFIAQHPNWRWSSWDWDYFHTYVRLRDGADVADLENKLNDAIAASASDIFTQSGFSMAFKFQNIKDIHLNSNLGRELGQNGNGDLLVFLEIVAYFMMILAWVNFVNLSTAISNLRAREVGVRKVVGANKTSLIFHYLMEALIYNVIASIIALAAIAIFKDLLEPITNFQFGLYNLVSWKVPLTLAVIIVLGTIGSGIFPALILTNVNTIKVLKGAFSSSSTGIAMRKFLVVFQFVMAIFLMAFTLGVHKQVDFLMQRDPGLNTKQVLVTNLPNIRSAGFWSDYDNFKNDLQQNYAISTVTASNEVPGTYLNHVELFKQQHQNREEAQLLKHVWIDYDFFGLYDLQIVAGHDFDINNQAEAREGVIINEEAARMLDFDNIEEAIGMPVDWVHSWGTIENYKLIGVVKDYEQEANSAPAPMVFIMNRPQEQWFEVNYIAMKVNTLEMSNVINEVKEAHNRIYPNDAFDYFFLDDHFNMQYKTDERFGKIFSFFSVLTLIITFLGLFGLSAFILLNKKKEIGIRWVLGARRANIIRLISLQFVLQILMALIIALPLIYLMLSIWLEKFVYKMNISLEIFMLPCLTVIFITAATIIFQVIRTVSSSPVDSLQD